MEFGLVIWAQAWHILNSAELLCLLKECKSWSVHTQGSSANTTVHPLSVACDSRRCLKFFRIFISNPGCWIMSLGWNWGKKGPLEMMDHCVPLKAQFTKIRMIRVFPSWFWFREWRSVAMSLTVHVLFLSSNQILLCFDNSIWLDEKLCPLPFSCHCAPQVSPSTPYLWGSLKTVKAPLHSLPFWRLDKPTLLKVFLFIMPFSPSTMMVFWWTPQSVGILCRKKPAAQSCSVVCLTLQTLLWKDVLYPDGSSPPIGSSYYPVAALCTCFGEIPHEVHHCLIPLIYWATSE